MVLFLQLDIWKEDPLCTHCPTMEVINPTFRAAGAVCFVSTPTELWLYILYRVLAGGFRGMQIFLIFMVNPQVTKFSTHEFYERMYVHSYRYMYGCGTTPNRLGDLLRRIGLTLSIPVSHWQCPRSSWSSITSCPSCCDR